MEQQQQQETSIKAYLSSAGVTKKFEELLGKKSTGFITSVLQVVNGNSALREADPASVYGAAAAAAVLDLPINNNLGFAYIVPYKENIPGGGSRKVAQFQLGYKGFVQLAQRSGQFKTISSAPIFEGQLISEDPLAGYQFDFTKKSSNTVIGYAAYFKLLNGFEKVFYMTIDELKAHGKKYSKTFDMKYGLWNTDFDGMCRKTVIKLLLSRFAPLSIEMQNAVIFDQAKVNNIETQDVQYIDNTEDVAPTKEEVEADRLLQLINEYDSVEELALIEDAATQYGLSEQYKTRYEQLSSK